MIIKRYTNYILIEELLKHYLGYDENTFIIEKNDGTPVPFLIEIVSEYSVKLLFEEDIIEEKIFIKINTNSENNIEILKLKEELSNNTEKKEDFPIKVEFYDEYINVLFFSKKEKFNPNKLKIKLIEYNLEQFSDFKNREINIPIKYNPLENDEVDDEFDFEVEFKLNYENDENKIIKDKIYKVVIKYKNNKKEYYYIHGNPTCYYSSIYHLEKTANNLNLILNKDNISDFDLKLIIWKNSKYVMGIVGATKDIKYDYNYSVLNDFVTKKCLLDFIVKGLKDSNLNPELATDTLKLISVTIGDFSHGASTETVTTQLIKVYNVLFKELEALKLELPKIFRYFQSDVAVNNNNYKGKTINRKTNFN